MTTLRDDHFAHRGAERSTSGVHAVMVFVLVFVSIALLMLSRLQHGYVKELRSHVENAISPVLNAAIVPLSPVRGAIARLSAYSDLYAELDRLREENQRMKGWEWRAREMDRKYSQLGRLARVVEEPGLDYVSARVVGDSRGPFARSVLLSAGRDRGMKGGFPVISGDGLIGRISDSGRSTSRILLLTDINSRIPVFIGRNNIRALMIGDNNATPRLSYTQPNGAPGSSQTGSPSNVAAGPNGGIEVGDEVSTSGVGGLFPRGLRVGTVTDQGGKLVVTPHAALEELDFVSVLLFENPTLELADSEKPSSRDPAQGRRAVVGRLSTPNEF